MNQWLFTNSCQSVCFITYWPSFIKYTTHESFINQWRRASHEHWNLISIMMNEGNFVWTDVYGEKLPCKDIHLQYELSCIITHANMKPIRCYHLTAYCNLHLTRFQHSHFVCRSYFIFLRVRPPIWVYDTFKVHALMSMF